MCVVCVCVCVFVCGSLSNISLNFHSKSLSLVVQGKEKGEAENEGAKVGLCGEDWQKMCVLFHECVVEVDKLLRTGAFRRFKQQYQNRQMPV